RGDADVLLVHAPEAEVEFMKAGHGRDRRLVMHNDFIIVGPKGDPAKVKGARRAAAGFHRIAAAKATFFSRGDESGTHKMELKLWRAAKVDLEGGWYQQSGQGMGATLKIASEKSAYTLTDRATYLALRKNLDLRILLERDAPLLNIYHVIVVSPEKHPGTNLQGAKAFADFMTAKGTQRLIGKFGTDKFGQPLFFPDAGKRER
ncbi:MAG: substrate-binding domain-containing protein, partial [Armatimonadetes bacterium]|nr:substrate-binding domain-containing protein [Armatimonadota bacterium]